MILLYGFLSGVIIVCEYGIIAFKVSNNIVYIISALQRHSNAILEYNWALLQIAILILHFFDGAFIFLLVLYHWFMLLNSFFKTRMTMFKVWWIYVEE